MSDSAHPLPRSSHHGLKLPSKPEHVSRIIPAGLGIFLAVFSVISFWLPLPPLPQSSGQVAGLHTERPYFFGAKETITTHQNPDITVIKKLEKSYKPLDRATIRCGRSASDSAQPKLNGFYRTTSPGSKTTQYCWKTH